MGEKRISARVAALISAISLGIAFAVGYFGGKFGLANTRYLNFLIASPYLAGAGFGFVAARTENIPIRIVGIAEVVLGGIYGCIMLVIGTWGLS